MKKLLITASTFPRWENDTEPRFILDYAKAMSKYYDITVLVPAAIGAKDHEIMEGIPVKRFHYFPIHSLETLCYPGAIVSRIKQKKLRLFLVPFLLVSMYSTLKKLSLNFDLVHAHWLIPQGIMQSFVKGIPFIVTGHGGDVTSLNHPLIQRLKLRTLEKAEKITVVSDALKDYIQTIYPNHKTRVISMGCNVKLFHPKNREENYFNQGDKKVILFVGRLVEKKGVPYLIDAIKHTENTILVIVGKGALEPSLRRQALPLGDRVVFFGAKTHQDLPRIYASADIFVAPSVTAEDGDKEGFGLVLIEAMASGLPVVASNSGGITDIIKDNVNGLLCEEKCVSQIAGCINSLLNDRHKAQKLIQNGLETAASYSYDSIAAQYRLFFEEE